MTSQQQTIQQRQALSMTPQLQQSIKLLQLPAAELAAFIDEQVISNPLLEYKEGRTEGEVENEGPTEHATTSDKYSFDWAINNAVDESGNLFREHLLEQINIDFTSETDKHIAYILVDQLNESGFFTQDYHHVAKKIGCSTEDLERIIAQLKCLDPTGVFACDIKECMQLQLEEHNHYDPMIATVLNHLDLVAQQDTKKLAALCHATEQEVFDIITEIRALNPKPTAGYNTDSITIKQCDVMVIKEGDDSYRVELNTELLPKVLINNNYYQSVKRGAHTKDEKQYLTEQYQSANWLTRSLNQRAETLLAVASEIVERQQDFLDKGVFYLKPLRLQDIAEKLDIHESTVARVVANKFMETERGIHELKYFFSSAIPQSDSDNGIASTAVKQMIKELIDNESPNAILSDAKIVESLQKKGLDIARRTVAKYRESMRIGSSSERRKIKRIKH